MTLVKLSTQELRQVLMEETKKLTSAIREGTPLNERDELKKRIEDKSIVHFCYTIIYWKAIDE